MSLCVCVYVCVCVCARTCTPLQPRYWLIRDIAKVKVSVPVCVCVCVGARHSSCHTTYASFSNRGDRLVATYHRDQAYCFDVSSTGCESARYPLHLDTYTQTQQQQPSQPRRCSELVPLRGRRRLRAQLAGAVGAAAGMSGGAEAAYVDLTAAARMRRPPATHTQQPQSQPQQQSGASSASPDPYMVGLSTTSGPLPESVEAERLAGNRAMFDCQWDKAVMHLTR